jgi:phosphatidylglycerophosphate synthase
MTSINYKDIKYTLAPPETLFPITRHFSYRITPVLLKYPITPNQVTVASLIIGLLGGVCFVFGQWGWDITGALLLVLAFTLDNCDGEIARAKKLFSPFGAKLDDVSDSLTDAMFFGMLGYGTASATGEAIWLWLGLATVAGTAIDYAICVYNSTREDPGTDTRHEQASNPKKPQSITDWVLYLFQEMSHAEFCNIILLLALFDATWILLPLGAIGAQVYWIVALFPRARGWHV